MSLVNASPVPKLRLAAMLLTLPLAGCNPEYTRWIPRERDIESFLAAEDEPAEARDAPGAPGSPRSPDGKGKPYGKGGVPPWAQQLSPTVQGVEPSRTGRSWLSRVLGPDDDRYVRSLRSQFATELWRTTPFAVLNDLKIKASPDAAAASSPARSRLARRNASRLLAMYRDEFEEIDAAKQNKWSKRIGLALSGGGIRSASFSTGVLQGLSQIEALESIGYLSSVSGGGYAAAWFMTQGKPKEILADGSLDLHHVAQNGNYLVSSHYSATASELAGKSLFHTLLTPGHWLVNGLFDWDINWWAFRNFYRRGIEQAFLYRSPCAGDGDTVAIGGGTMCYYSPLTRPHRPFWIINSHLALTADPTSQYRNRSGDAFELTPLRAGADAVGYVEVPGIECRQVFRIAEALDVWGRRWEEWFELARLRPGQREIIARTIGSLRAQLETQIGATFESRLQWRAAAILGKQLVEPVRRWLRGRPAAPPTEGAEPLEAESAMAFEAELQAFFIDHEEEILDVLRALFRGQRYRGETERDGLIAELEAIRCSGQPRQALMAALDRLEARPVAAPEPRLTRTLRGVVQRLARDGELLELYRAARSPLRGEESLWEVVRQVLAAGELDAALLKEVKKVAAGMENEWEVRRLFNRLLKYLLPRSGFYDLLRPEIQRRERAGEMPAAAAAALETLVSASGETLHWHDTVHRNRDLLEALFPEAFDRGNAIHWMSPSHGVAMSGAAVDSQSLKQGWLLSQLTPALNYDLGYYVDGWGDGWVAGDRRSPIFKRLGFYASSPLPVYKLLPLPSPKAWHEQTQWGAHYYLTDGGHFENLGIYALIRRGCRFIIASDAGADPLVNRWDDLPATERGKAFEDLRVLESRLRADFGAELEMSWDDFSVRDRSEASGFGAAPAETVLVGTIRGLPVALEGGGDGPPGAQQDDVVRIVYIKAAYDFDARMLDRSTFIDKEKAETPEFPHESTSRQLYSEQKVLAHRALARSLVLGGRVRDLIAAELQRVKAQYDRDVNDHSR